jgi:hypothetical protein
MKRLLRTDRVLFAVLFLGLFAMAARNAVDPDMWWHLRTGEYIAEHRGVPHTDPFSFTRAGQPWVAHEWLTELLMYELQRFAGFGGLIVTFAATLCAAFFLLYMRCGAAPYIAGVATLCGAWATAPVWGVRPQVVSLLLTGLWLVILERSERRPNILWWTLPLTLLWVNLHAGFALGLALSALFLIGEVVELRFGSPLAQGPQRLRTAAFILVLDLLIVPLNPNGWRLFSYPIETLRSTAMQNYIAEWASPNFHRAEYWPFLLIVLATVAMLSWSRRAVRPRDLILLLAGLYAGLASIRMTPLFVLIAVPLISKRLGNWPRSELRQSKPRASRAWVNAGIVLGMAVFASVRIAQVIERQPEAEARQFPSRAVAFLQAHPPSGRMFNDYDWGGYLIWRLYPAVPVFIDGRADLYIAIEEHSKRRSEQRGEGQDEPLFHEFADAYQLKGSWQSVLQRWKIQTVLIPPDSALVTGLLSAPGWTVAYQDAQSVIMQLEIPQPEKASVTSTIGGQRLFPVVGPKGLPLAGWWCGGSYSRYAIYYPSSVLWRVLWFIFWTISVEPCGNRYARSPECRVLVCSARPGKKSSVLNFLGG